MKTLKKSAKIQPSNQVLSHFYKPNVYAQLALEAKDHQQQSHLNQSLLNILYALTSEVQSFKKNMKLNQTNPLKFNACKQQESRVDKQELLFDNPNIELFSQIEGVKALALDARKCTIEHV